MSRAVRLQTYSDYPSWRVPGGERVSVFPDHPCPYLPPRTARIRAFEASSLAPDEYLKFMDAGFRRSGTFVYQPMCPGCRACRPIRIPVTRFEPGKSQRRCFRRNNDLLVTVDEPKPTQEKFGLYCRYLHDWHHRTEKESPRDFVRFLYLSPVESIEFSYRDTSGRLLAVGLCDVGPNALSSVYFYFDPAYRSRGLGTYGALVEIEWARTRGISHYYLGYHVAGCAAMSYKASFRPHEFLDTDGVWRESRAP